MLTLNDLKELHRQFHDSGKISEESRAKLIEAIKSKSLEFSPDTICCEYYNQGRLDYDKTDSNTCRDLLLGKIVDSSNCK